MTNTNENNKTEKLGGVTPGFTSEVPELQVNPPKKHTRKRRRSRGWIRGIKKANGKTYYYYCYSFNDGHGNYPEKKIYLGSAERILENVKGRQEQ